MKQSQFQYNYTNDPRSQDEQLNHSKIIEYYSKRNFKAFLPYVQQQLQNQCIDKSNNIKLNVNTMKFEDDRYVNYRDNIDYRDQFELKNKTIIFITGVPGGINYYKKIQNSIGQQFCRMIDIYIPGFDKKDERRGQYQGGIDQIAKLIDDFMIKIGIQSAVFLAHSYGGIVVKNFIYFKPHKVEGFIQICTVPMTLWEGQKKLEQLEHQKYNLDFNKISYETLSDENFRQQLKYKIIQTKESLQMLSEQEKFQLGPIVAFSFQDIITMLKIRLSVYGKYNEIFHRFRQLNQNIPRMIAYSKNDVLISANTIEEEIYQYILSENALKRRITKLESPEPHLDLNNFSSNYIFRFDDTTHFLQNEKSEEIGIIAKNFIKQIDSTQIINNKPNL
ncbi:alpha/beta hydrolase family protein (macronuclear) [Tetrahymena thermophila SB210]|uniref:Alpha/beta hydrolase family protein n=1 Tax=Tetrahymena thermophila (strain SB210) TaxID=312017 RepID=Q24FE2_TETTS|nr:alpha/beta hydrolase family protein [Tetrahymena thermophila SB210]EAS06516.1 alpha/beta hydrolase family protein [Tetrahymena thermophila SB210]|eukprot:XP_001026761.1 alpha/beta hydrolase family protein [Tetrahymena thermophila SB210]